MLNSNIIARLSTYALIYEVSLSPKPGLVTLLDTGAHVDMDYIDFLNSALVLHDYFKIAYELGEKSSGEDYDELRKFGIIYEKKMKDATHGANTHKGIIFSLGLMVYATAIEIKRKNFSYEKVISRVSYLNRGITRELNKKTATSHGEENYKKYGVKGIREEAEEGFSKALMGLKFLKEAEKSVNFDYALTGTLYYYMSFIEDSNIIKRGGLEGLKFLKESANYVLTNKLYKTSCGMMEIEKVNKEFKRRNLSPGGCADFLILTLYFYLLEDYID
ncbi:MAG: triphosphoribosyl-dephospho-CoA synthase [Peptoniphilus sp.]|uniref:triphosphoribosyl-dephospho-CoA synthase n=1 Tax=Peptoniphilus sp. TaxID=1971214 RepID=UPI0025FBA5DB|nr:triphosphoribosyl-dephospho-CoA synthase [Peptoniphilus sp.]MCI5642493.1 triphosphoribosyl-dephospho-CoA synthase [Peptoniphilus sp.]MDD7352039.1 triphosphoribosyl-dephospho-CoA synthase [Peptoniphilaceae bacterium]